MNVSGYNISDYRENLRKNGLFCKINNSICFQIKISALELPLYSGETVHCLDVLFAIVRRVIGDVEISPEIKELAETMLVKYFPNRKQLEANTTTLILRNQIRAARMIQVDCTFLSYTRHYIDT